MCLAIPALAQVPDESTAGSPIESSTETERPGPRYLEAVENELRAVGFAPACEVLTPPRARCEFDRVDPRNGARMAFVAVIDDTTHTVYLYSRLGHLSAEDERAPMIFARLLDFGWQSLALKFEWSSASGEIRVSSLIHTDSNFDRRAFRVLLRLLRQEAPRIRRVLAAALGPSDPSFGDLSSGDPGFR